ncbi:MAG: 4-hydroxy-tetrahydrodipicolinate synthase, partial [Actinobacteria bacterium]|nr:4-hydroxy-tetrahydrodipicolinate synthase [Actinomycetota bacterium]
MVTPFREDGSLDVGAARRIARYLVDHDSEGIVVGGTTGEAPTLSRAEKLQMFDVVLDEVGSRARVIAGTGTYDTKESVELTTEAGRLGVDACLAVTPYYSKPPQNGLLAHFMAVADASSVPVIIYDIPGRTGRRVERPTMVALADHERIVAVKDAVGDPSESARLRSDLDRAGHANFEMYCGDDVLLLPLMAAGAVGVISVCSHVAGPQIKQIFSAWADGKVEEARRIYIDLSPLMNTIMAVTASPIPIKAACNLAGLPAGAPRLPLVAATSEEEATIRRAMEGAGLL